MGREATLWIAKGREVRLAALTSLLPSHLFYALGFEGES